MALHGSSRTDSHRERAGVATVDAQHGNGRSEPSRGDLLNPLFVRLAGAEALPRDRITQHEALPETVREFIAEELALDGNARLNLATFVTTWMEPEARELMVDAIDKNMVDKDEYPRTAAIEQRCVNILAHLWNAPGEDFIGTSTCGSSEACMLGGLALKWRWRDRMREQGKSTERPNLVMGSNVQVVWEKFCRYFDVEMRLVDVEEGIWHLEPEAAAAACDENTIGVVAVLGSTYDGSYEPVAEIAAALDALQQRTGLDVPMHVDGASGGFVAPFIDPELEWDFRIDRVMSINASGHKYGLVYPGVGWAVWRDKEQLPEDLIFRVAYLGGDMPTFGLNFSRPGAQVVAQYYNFLRLGFDGFAAMQQALRDIALHISERAAAREEIDVIADGSALPVVTFRLTNAESRNYTVYDLSERLRIHGWTVPAYPMPPSVEDVHVLRVVVRNGMSLDLAMSLMDDVEHELDLLEQHGALKTPKPVAFHH